MEFRTTDDGIVWPPVVREASAEHAVAADGRQTKCVRGTLEVLTWLWLVESKVPPTINGVFVVAG